LLNSLGDALLVAQTRQIFGKENGPAHQPAAREQHRKSGAAAAAAVADRRRSEAVVSKKASAAAAPPDTEAKPLSERLETNRKRSAAGSQEWQEQEGSPLKKHKANKSAAGTAQATNTDATLTHTYEIKPECCMPAVRLDCWQFVLAKCSSGYSAWQFAFIAGKPMPRASAASRDLCTVLACDIVRVCDVELRAMHVI
jgi:hypothetical protein